MRPREGPRLENRNNLAFINEPAESICKMQMEQLYLSNYALGESKGTHSLVPESATARMENKSSFDVGCGHRADLLRCGDVHGVD